MLGTAHSRVRLSSRIVVERSSSSKTKSWIGRPRAARSGGGVVVMNDHRLPEHATGASRRQSALPHSALGRKGSKLQETFPCQRKTTSRSHGRRQKQEFTMR